MNKDIQFDEPIYKTLVPKKDELNLSEEQMERVVRLFIDHFQHVADEIENFKRALDEKASEVKNKILCDVLELGGGR